MEGQLSMAQQVVHLRSSGQVSCHTWRANKLLLLIVVRFDQFRVKVEDQEKLLQTEAMVNRGQRRILTDP